MAAPKKKLSKATKLKAQNRARSKQKAMQYTLKSRYSKQPRRGKTHAWKDLQTQAARVLRQRRPRNHLV